jgi:cold shock CspA family protein
MEGRVLWFKGTYGFLRPDETNEEIFFFWTDIKTDDEYKILYTGDQVSFDVVEEVKSSGEVKLRALNIEKQERISSFGRPIMRLSFIDMKQNLELSYIECYITSKTRNGLKYLNIAKDMIVATDKRLDKDEVEKLCHILKIHDVTNKLFYAGEGFRYDLNLV